MTLHPVISALPYEFFVPGSPVSVNRYGTPDYRNWRADVYAHSTASSAWVGCLVSTGCSVRIRYFWHLDRRKDVDNILKAILDGLDGKSGIGPKHLVRVLQDDRDIEHVVSQRTKLDFRTRLNARRLRPDEYAAARNALSGQAAVFVSVRPAPNHSWTVTR